MRPPAWVLLARFRRGRLGEVGAGQVGLVSDRTARGRSVAVDCNLRIVAARVANAQTPADRSKPLVVLRHGVGEVAAGAVAAVVVILNPVVVVAVLLGVGALIGIGQLVIQRLNHLGPARALEVG